MNKPTPNATEIRKALETLFEPGDVIELRALHKKRKRTDAGYFDGDHRTDLVKAAVKLNSEAAAVYVTMNPLDPQLLGRYSNRIEEYASDTTTDSNVTRRRWLLIDVDPARPKNTAATDAQLDQAKATAREVFKFLRGAGWPDPVTAESGNGMHLIYRVNLPNDNDARDTIKGILDALGSRFDTDAVTIDRSVFNAARIIKFHGTVSTKGDHTPAAPWRLSKIISIPANIDTVSLDQLRALAPAQTDKGHENNRWHLGTPFDLDNFLARLGIPYTQDRHDSRDRYKLTHCPFNPEHGKGEAAIFRDNAGALGFKCQHNGCADRSWRDVRELVDGPRGEYRQNSKKPTCGEYGRTEPPHDAPLLFDDTDTPEISPDLLPGWLGEYVDAVARSTQTPPAMAVMLALSAVATCTAKRFDVEADHVEPLNLWTATVLPPANRKTAVISAITAPLVDYEKDEADRLAQTIKVTAIKRRLIEKRIDQLEREAGKAKTDRETQQRLIADLLDEMPAEVLAPRLWTGDITPERLQGLLADHGERMAVLTDEGGIFEVMAGLYNDGRANLDIFLKAHAGSAARVDRQGRTAHLDAPALSFGLAIQPAILADMGSGGKRRFRGNGTLARFLYVVPVSNVGSRDVRAVYRIPATVAASYQAGLLGLLKCPPQLIDGREVPRRLTLKPHALDSWYAFAEMIEQRQGPGGDLENISDWSGKLPGAALRIAGNLHLVEYGTTPPAQIDVTTIERALELCALLIDHAKAAFALMDADPATADAKAVFRWIEAERLTRFKRGDLWPKFKGRFTGRTERLDKALKELERRHIVTAATEQTTGRAATVYTVNSTIWGAA